LRRRGRSRGLALLAAAALVASCGGGDDEAGAGAAPFAPAGDATLADCRTVVLVLVDGLGPGDLPAVEGAVAAADDARREPPRPDLPALASLVAGGQIVETAVTPSTSGSAALASVLTGLSPEDHGVRSIHDVARARLSPDVPTVAERLAGAGWRGFASLSSRRESRGVGGFARGYEAVDDVPQGQVARGAAAVALGLRDALGDALDAEDTDLFITLTFADLSGQVAADLDHPRAAAIVRARLAREAGRDDELAAIVARLDRDARGALGDLEKRFRRSRGSGAAQAWRGALRDLRLVAIDYALADLLEQLRDARRAEGALVVVAGLRGGGLDPVARGEEAGRIPLSVATVPLVVRAPGSVGAGPVEGLASTRAIAPWLASVLASREGAADASALVGDGPAATHNARGDAVALRTPDGRAFERDLSGVVAAIDADGAAPSAATDAEAALVVDALDGAPSTPSLFARIGAEFPGEVRWRVSEGGAARRGAPFRPSAYGDLDGESPSLSILERGASLQLMVRGAAPDRVALGPGAVRLTDAPLAYTPSADAPGLGEDAEPRLEFTRAPGLDWTLRVNGEGRCEALVTVWPPRRFDDRVESVGYGVTIREVPGRRDLVHVIGDLPLEVAVQKKGVESFAVVCWTEDGFLRPDEMAYDGAWFATADGFDLVVPGWRPAVSERIGDPFDALRVEGAAALPEPAANDLHLGRHERGPGPSRATALPLDLYELLLQLPAGE